MSEEPEDQEVREDRVRYERLLEELATDAQVATFQRLLSQEAVRDLLWRILIQCNVYGSVYNRHHGDMALAEGRRMVGLWLLKEICVADPAAEMLMRQKSIAIEHAKRMKEQERRGRKAPQP